MATILPHAELRYGPRTLQLGSPPTTSWETRSGRRRLLVEVRLLLAGENHGGGG